MRLVIIVFVVTALTFLMINLLPGDVAYEIAGREATAEDIQVVRRQLGLDDSLPVRYVKWLGKCLTGDLGTSFRTRQQVLDEIIARLPVTIELMLFAQIFALTAAIPAGIASAYKSGSWIDKSLSATSFATMSIPNFVMALVLIYLFAIELRWLPATGYIPISQGLWPNIRSFVLPAMSIAMIEWVPLMRVLRSDMITTLQQDFILMAKSKGLPARHILIRHALRPSSFTLITLVGIHVGHLIGGALIVETIFALPGIGRLLVGAIYGRDYNMVQGCILFITVAYVTINFVVDLVYLVLDPRIRSEAAVD